MDRRTFIASVPALAVVPCVVEALPPPPPKDIVMLRAKTGDLVVPAKDFYELSVAPYVPETLMDVSEVELPHDGFFRFNKGDTRPLNYRYCYVAAKGLPFVKVLADFYLKGSRQIKPGPGKDWFNVYTADGVTWHWSMAIGPSYPIEYTNYMVVGFTTWDGFPHLSWGEYADRYLTYRKKAD
jgi:hypothetical protein